MPPRGGILLLGFMWHFDCDRFTPSDEDGGSAKGSHNKTKRASALTDTLYCCLVIALK
jgi:hypothetical protein